MDEAAAVPGDDEVFAANKVKDLLDDGTGVTGDAPGSGTNRYVFFFFLPSSNVLDVPLPPYIFLTMMMIFLAMMMMIFLTKFLMIVLILILISYCLSLFQEFQAAEKMVVLQSLLVDLFPPDFLAWP